jgi:tetratricopeptide (TPR) repeat protein
MLKARIVKITVIFFILIFLQVPIYVYSQSTEIPITTTTDEARSFFMEGRYKYENIQYATASALFDEAILTDPGFAMAYLYRARCGGSYNLVNENLSRAEALINNVSEGEKYLIQFQIALQDEDQIMQKEYIDKLLDLYPNDKRAHFNAGLYYDFILEPEAALKHYFKAIKIDPNYAAAYNKIGYDFIDLNFLSAAEEAFKKYIALIPNSPNPYDSYAELLMKLGQYEESIGQYQTAYRKDVLYTQALAGVGHNYIFLGDYEKARENYLRQHEKATRMNEKLEALQWVAISYVHEGNIDEAINTLKLRLEFADRENLVLDVIDTYNMMSFILIENGNPDEAIKYHEMILEKLNGVELDGETLMGLKVDNHMNNCLLLAKSKQLAKAKVEMTKCDKAVIGRKNAAERKKMNLVMGIYALMDSRPEDALDHFGKADTEDPYTWYHMAMAYNDLGYTDHAKTLQDRIKYWNQNSLEYAIVKNKN